MLRIGRSIQVDCGSVTRRELLRVGTLSALGLSCPSLLRAQSPAEPVAPAKAIILLWLWGGPSHLDTFDLKPDAPTEYRGPYAPIDTNVPGIRIGELFPKLARRADKYAVIRSLNCNSNDHGIAGTIGLTGSDHGALSLGGQTLPGQLKPAHGAVVSKVLGFSPGTPKFMTIGENLHQGHKPITGEGGGSVGALYDPFRLNYEVETGVKVPNLQLLDGLSPSGMENRRALLRNVDHLARQLEHSADFARMDEFYRQAFSLLTDPGAREMFNIDAEPENVRRNYGNYRFGQCCLLARRLVEAGAKFVQVNWSSHVEPVEDTGDGGWDMHDRYFQQHQDRHAWMLDRALSALLDDLSERGLLDQTVVVAVGEFGRTPKINDKSGRDHWNQCYSGLIAGGGLRCGQVIGASDRLGEYPAEQPVTPADLFTTALTQMSIGTTQLTANGLVPLGEQIEALV